MSLANATDYWDQGGHGTATISVIAGNGSLGFQHRGVSGAAVTVGAYDGNGTQFARQRTGKSDGPVNTDADWTMTIENGAEAREVHYFFHHGLNPSACTLG